MTRTELILHLLHQARDNGFEFRKWLRIEAAHTWTTADDALQWLCLGNRVNMLLFSHTFARAFFKSGSRVRYILPPATFERVGRDGQTKIVQRRAYTRESNHIDVWQYHIRQMVAVAEPLRYARRFLMTEESLNASNQPIEPQELPVMDPEEVDYDEELLVRE